MKSRENPLELMVFNRLKRLCVLLSKVLSIYSWGNFLEGANQTHGNTKPAEIPAGLFR